MATSSSLKCNFAEKWANGWYLSYFTKTAIGEKLHTWHECGKSLPSNFYCHIVALFPSQAITLKLFISKRFNMKWQEHVFGPNCTITFSVDIPFLKQIRNRSFQKLLQIFEFYLDQNIGNIKLLNMPLGREMSEWLVFELFHKNSHWRETTHMTWMW